MKIIWFPIKNTYFQSSALLQYYQLLLNIDSSLFFLYTVELQWLEHLWDYENLFETGVVRAIEGFLWGQIRRHNRDTFSVFFNIKVYCVFSLESPQRGDSNVYIQYTISQYKKENHPKLSQICNYGICSKELKNEFETAVVNELSVFEPLKFYCILYFRFWCPND